MRTRRQDYGPAPRRSGFVRAGGTTGLRRGGAAPAPQAGPRTTAHVSRSPLPAPRSRFPAPRSPLHAFTLLELLTVIAIMGILAAIALPTLNSLKPNAAAAASRQLLDAVSQARQLAIAQRTTVYMVFVPPNFFNDTAYNYSSWSASDQNLASSLLDKQLVGYAYVSLRSVGDQPGLSYPRYLSPWRTLPQGAYIAPEKFTGYNTLYPPPLVLQIFTNKPIALPAAYQVFAFNLTNGIPFPSETTPKYSPARPYVTLAYIAFDSTGQLVSGSGARPELIPVTQGSVAFARDPATKQALPQQPTVRDVPSGNTTNNFNLVYVDQLTGRARIDHTKVQ